MKKIILLTIALLLVCKYGFAWTVDGLEYTTRKKITIQTTNVGSDLTDFPVYIKISNDADIADSNADGFDIRFTQSDGSTLLKYERESWTGGGGSAVTADFWVKANVADGVGESATDIYIYYRTTDTADGAEPSNVWSNGQVGVWHMAEGTGDVVGDSLGVNNGSRVNATWTPDGKIGSCLSFDGSGDYVNCGDINVDEGIPSLSVSFWIKANIATPADTEHLLVRYGGTGQEGWLFRRFTDNTFDFWVSPAQARKYTAPLNDLQWHHIVGVYNGSNVLLYFDTGLSTGEARTGNTPTGITTPLYIGALQHYSTGYFNGTIDNVMIFNRALGADEITFAYYNQDATASGGDYELTWESEESSTTPSTVEMRNNVTLRGNITIKTE